MCIFCDKWIQAHCSLIFLFQLNYDFSWYFPFKTGLRSSIPSMSSPGLNHWLGGYPAPSSPIVLIYQPPTLPKCLSFMLASLNFFNSLLAIFEAPLDRHLASHNIWEQITNFWGAACLNYYAYWIMVGVTMVFARFEGLLPSQSPHWWLCACYQLTNWISAQRLAAH